MRSTGITRKVDQLGRIVLPKELRDTLDIVEDETKLEIFVDGQDIILRKFQSGGCIFCGEMNGVKVFKGKKVCIDCVKELV